MYWSWKLVYSVVKIRLVLKLWLHISSLSAWLARLWEVTVKSGLVVIVSRTKEWNKDNLAQYFGNKWVIPKHASQCKIGIENVYTYTTMVELFAVYFLIEIIQFCRSSKISWFTFKEHNVLLFYDTSTIQVQKLKKKTLKKKIVHQQ